MPTLLIAIAVLFAAAAGAQPLLPHLIGSPAPGSVLLPCGQPAGSIELTASTHLDPACTYVNNLEITASNLVLDCRGATLEAPEAGNGQGIRIRVPTTVALSNVTVRNCIVRGYQNSVRVARQGFKDLLAGGEYVNAFSNILIENSRFLDAKASGVFIDGYVTDVTLRTTEVAGAGGVGVYLEAGSKGNLVTRCDIHDNGYGDVVPEGVLINVGGTAFRYRSTGREGIAVDGSRDNRIVRNQLTNNAAGGIFLYKNCGEDFTNNPNGWWTRRYGADGNYIARNTVTQGDNGIWLGARMNENQVFMDCSDPPYVSTSGVRLYEDFARDNLIVRNRFVDVRYGIRIEDDHNRVAYNRFSSTDPTHQAILLGTRDRTTVLGQPVDGTELRGNRAEIAGNAQPYGATHPHQNTLDRGNRAAGVVVALTAAAPPPINPFLFAKLIWLDGTPPPP
ncbi:MAG: right-handed parallel beta-helix repeat-containing protein [Candidatus Binatia bacterium]